MSDTRCTHDQHPAARMNARPGRTLTPRPPADDAGRAFITCEICGETAQWNDAADTGWQTGRAAYRYVCPACLRSRSCAGCGRVIRIRDDYDPPPPITEAIYCGSCDDDLRAEARARARSIDRYDEDRT